jgi:drug/metabolite transporter (DMT)-like permease
MEYYFLVVLGQLMLGLAHFSHKLFSRKSNSFLPMGTLYSALISLCSLPIFAILAGSALAVDGDLAFYSIAYGVLASLSQVMIFIAFSKVNMVVYSVFGKSASILVCLCGFIFFGDEVKFTSILSIVLLTMAIALPLLETKKKEGNKSSIASLIICVIMMLNGLFIQLVMKGYADLETTTFERSSALFFYANIITALALFVTLFIIARKGKDGKDAFLSEYRIGIAETAKTVPAKYYILIPITATIANIPCVTNTLCIQNMDLTVYTILLNAAESLVLFLISRFIFKEKSTKVEIASLVLSTIAGIVTVF